MKSLTLASLILLSLSFAGNAAAKPLVLSPEAKKALEASHPGFQTWTNENYTKEVRSFSKEAEATPWIQTGDINGDGKADFLLDGHDETSHILVAILSKGSAFTAVDIVNQPIDECYSLLTEMKNGKRVIIYYLSLGPASDEKGAPMEVSVDVPQRDGADGAMTTYQYLDGKFVEKSQVL